MIRLVESKISPGLWRYDVLLDGKAFNSFTSTKWLTNNEMLDIEAGYTEGLDGYRSPAVELVP